MMYLVYLVIKGASLLGDEFRAFYFKSLRCEEALALCDHAQEDFFYKPTLVLGFNCMSRQRTELTLVRDDSTSTLSFALIIT